MPVSFFFDDMPDAVKKDPRRRARALGDGPQIKFEADALNRRETLELVRAYYRITDSRVRKRLFELTKSLATKGSGR